MDRVLTDIANQIAGIFRDYGLDEREIGIAIERAADMRAAEASHAAKSGRVEAAAKDRRLA